MIMFLPEIILFRIFIFPKIWKSWKQKHKKGTYMGENRGLQDQIFATFLQLFLAEWVQMCDKLKIRFLPCLFLNGFNCGIVILVVLYFIKYESGQVYFQWSLVRSWLVSAFIKWKGFGVKIHQSFRCNSNSVFRIDIHFEFPFTCVSHFFAFK